MAKSILITGCSSGLGEDAARRLHARGWRVFATCRKPEDVARLKAEGLESFVLDVADPDSIAQGMAETLRRTGGTLDALFNNAGYGLPGAMEDVPPGALREIFETNVFGLHDLTCRAVAVMRAQGGHGRIVQHSSALGRMFLRWRGAYTASKHAVEGLADSLRLELRDTEIYVSILNTGPVTSKFRVNSIPGFETWIDWESSALADRYRTELIHHLYQDTGKAAFQLEPPAVTARLIHALEARRPRARYFITTATWIVEIARRVLPQRVFDWILAKA
ncbi:SDR family NAD(P)-dependent oxidoreductase [Rhodophyticola sp. CCM32]|uniref:SDR family NAD(P)-dependent oxidoreductase n=1 Tax=Rhodophyticola sp. CCM32 TaxID=2916397 RepID=UPI00107FAE69|nr:SDR family NAD(P)-dependent oxidoreductase [Rhodophyticola sp. CCM32]QBY02315.1 SDR family NAD(P)-dependent oxidoreductase [Rhodophyticola sp. CCM32]